MLTYFLIVPEASTTRFQFHYGNVLKLQGLLKTFELTLINKTTFQSGYITLLCFQQESLVSDTCSPRETFALQTSEKLRPDHFLPYDSENPSAFQHGTQTPSPVLLTHLRGGGGRLSQNPVFASR